MWEEAYSNTKNIKDKTYGMFYIQICKSCDVETESTGTNIRQQLGNVIETIHTCICGKQFVKDKVFGM